MSFPRLLALCLALLFAGALLAQDSGQICAAVFIDANENGQADSGELSATRGGVLHLLDKRGVTVAAMRLVSSLEEPSRLLCFDDLPSGEYQARLTSSHYRLTTAAAVHAEVDPGWPPARLEFGLAPIEDAVARVVEEPARTVSGEQAQFIAGLILAGLTLSLGLFMGYRLVRGRGQSRSRRRRYANRSESSPVPLMDDEDTRPTANV